MTILLVRNCIAVFFSVYVYSARSSEADVHVYFSPNGGASDAVISALQRARRSVYVQAYSFTHSGIAKALVDAGKRGVAIEVILDKSNLSAKYSSADFILRAGIATYIDSSHAIAHNKVMIIDESNVITGSFNFTKAAESSNAENLLTIDSVSLAGQYLRNWREHRAHSRPYTGKS